MKMTYGEAYTPAEELVRFDTVYRLSGGFNLVTEGLPVGYIIPPLAPIKVDMSKREATLLSRVRVLEVSGKVVKVSKHSYIPSAGAFLSSGKSTITIASVDRSNDGFDVITATADVANINVGDILFQATTDQSNKALGEATYLTYAPVKVEDGAILTAIGAGMEVKTGKLYIPLTEGDKRSLGHRFLFV